MHSFCIIYLDFNQVPVLLLVGLALLRLADSGGRGQARQLTQFIQHPLGGPFLGQLLGVPLRLTRQLPTLTARNERAHVGRTRLPCHLRVFYVIIDYYSELLLALLV